MTKEQLIAELAGGGYLRTPLLIEAFKNVDRRDFVPVELAREAYNNYPLSIGYGQTISQPLTVVFMLELLDVQAGNKVMDIGTGSGWQTALLAYLVGKEGRIVGIERIPELKKMTELNVGQYKELNRRTKILLGDGSRGISEEAPFDRIIAGAAAGSIPKFWLEQLGEGGILVAPIGNSVLKILKGSRGKIKQEEYYGFAFVPLIYEE